MQKAVPRMSQRLAESGKGSDAAAAKRIAESIARISKKTKAVVIKKAKAAGQVPEEPVTEGGEVHLESPSDPSGIRVVLNADNLAQLKARKSVQPDKGLNMFHEQFAGIKKYPLEMLRVFAEAELRQIADWDEEKEKEMYPKLFKAVPAMSNVYGGDNAMWPEPVGFSPPQVKQLYVNFLEFSCRTISCSPSQTMIWEMEFRLLLPSL